MKLSCEINTYILNNLITHVNEQVSTVRHYDFKLGEFGMVNGYGSNFIGR